MSAKTEIEQFQEGLVRLSRQNQDALIEKTSLLIEKMEATQLIADRVFVICNRLLPFQYVYLFGQRPHSGWHVGNTEWYVRKAIFERMTSRGLGETGKTHSDFQPNEHTAENILRVQIRIMCGEYPPPTASLDQLIEASVWGFFYLFDKEWEERAKEAFKVVYDRLSENDFSSFFNESLARFKEFQKKKSKKLVLFKKPEKKKFEGSKYLVFAERLLDIPASQRPWKKIYIEVGLDMTPKGKKDRDNFRRQVCRVIGELRK